MAHSWNSPNPKPFTHLTLDGGKIHLEDPSADVTSIGRDDLLRIHAEAGSRALGIAHRSGGVQLSTFSFGGASERDEAVELIERELGLSRSVQTTSGGWADAVKPGLYVLVTLMITFGLFQGVAQGADGIDAAGHTAAKAGMLLQIGGLLGPTGVLVLGGVVTAFFLFRTLSALRVSGDRIILEPKGS